MAGAAEATFTEWALGVFGTLLAAAVLGCAGACSRLFSRVRDLEEGRKLDSQDREKDRESLKDLHSEFRESIRELFEIARNTERSVADVRVSVAEIARNGHGGK